jgi:Phage integrase family
VAGRRGRDPGSDGRLKPPRVPGKPVAVFTAEDLPRLERACAGRGFAQRRDAALIAVFTATGIRLSELAGIRYDAGDPGRSDVDLWHREITVQGKDRKPRTVKISFRAARSLDRYLRVRAGHAQAWRPQLWLGVNNRGPMTASGIYQVTVRRGRQCGIEVFPHRFRHHFSHTWLDHGGAEGDLMELNGWTSPRCSPLRRQRPQRPSPPQLRPHHDRPAVTRAITGQRAPPPGPPRLGRGHRSPSASAGPAPARCPMSYSSACSLNYGTTLQFRRLSSHGGGLPSCPEVQFGRSITV